MEPVASRNAAERLALALSHAPVQDTLPELGQIGRMSDIVLIGDFLDTDETLETCIGPAARRGIRGHVIEVADPAEEVFPYSGRTEFRDPETGQKLVAGRAETVAADYRRPGLPAVRRWRKAYAAWAGAFSPTAPTAWRPKHLPQPTVISRAFRQPRRRHSHDCWVFPSLSAHRQSCSDCSPCR
jgi:hypothetical protein